MQSASVLTHGSTPCAGFLDHFLAIVFCFFSMKRWFSRLLENKLFFIQINTGDETQKSGVSLNNAEKFLEVCKNNEVRIDGLMCLPPENETPDKHFEILQSLAKNNHLKYLSMETHARTQNHK